MQTHAITLLGVRVVIATGRIVETITRWWTVARLMEHGGEKEQHVPSSIVKKIFLARVATLIAAQKYYHK